MAKYIKDDFEPSKQSVEPSAILQCLSVIIGAAGICTRLKTTVCQTYIANFEKQEGILRALQCIR